MIGSVATLGVGAAAGALGEGAQKFVGGIFGKKG